MSMAPDYLVEVRDSSFTRLGQIAPEFLDLKLSEVFRGVGAWEMKLPAEHPLLDALKSKGSGIVVTQRSSGYVFSGRMQSCVLSQDATDPVGTWKISGVDDNVIAAATLVYPDPAHDASAQTTGYWVTTGPGETVMRQAVQLNAGSAAIASRKYAWLSVPATSGTGTAVSTSSRFDVLGDLLTSIGIQSGLGWRFAASATGVTFLTYQPSDKTALVQLDIRNGGLTSTELGFSAPTATEVLVLGQGEGAGRTVRKVSTVSSLAEATAWGLRWEQSKDQRNTDDPTELQKAGEEILSETGTTIHSLKLSPSDAPNQRLGVDWGLGDKITVVIDGQPTQAIVTEIATSITSAGLIRQATVGDPIGFDWEAKVGSAIRQQDTRIGNLETLVDAGVSWGGIDGKPAALSQPGVFADIADIKMTARLTAPAGWLLCDGSSVSRTTYSALFSTLVQSIGVATVTVASPGVFTKTAHGLAVGDKVSLTTTGALPTGLTQFTSYFVIAAGLTANTFQLSATQTGAGIVTTGTQSGVHTVWLAPYGLVDATTFRTPDMRGKTPVGVDASQTEFIKRGIAGGAKTHQLDISQMPSHRHTGNSADGGNFGYAEAGGPTLFTMGYGPTRLNTGIATSLVGGDQPHNNLQPYSAVNFIIYAGV